jgi:hypothetical protein
VGDSNTTYDTKTYEECNDLALDLALFRQLDMSQNKFTIKQLKMPQAIPQLANIVLEEVMKSINIPRR